MSIPKPPEPDDYDFKPLSPKNKPNLKDFDHESNWITSATNPLIEINIVTGRMRTKDMFIPNGPKTTGNP